MSKVIALLIPLQLVVFAICAQSLTPSVVASQGAYNETASFNLEWTLGETFIETTPERAIMLTEGLHQPTLPFREVRSVNSPFYSQNVLDGDQKSQSNIEVYPNPFQSEISVKVVAEVDQDYKITLLDVNGMIIRKSTIPSEIGSMTINGLDLPPAIYLIKVQGVSDNEVHVREVIKFN